MSLQDIYNSTYGAGAAQAAGTEAEKTAEDKEIEALLGKFSEEDCEKLAAAGDLLDSFKMEFEGPKEKLAAACNLVDHMSAEANDGDKGGDAADKGGDAKSGDAAEGTSAEAEKLAAEYDAAGRIMARGLIDELNKAGVGETAPEGSLRAKLGY